MDEHDIRHREPVDGTRHVLPEQGFFWVTGNDTMVLSSTDNPRLSWHAARPGKGEIPYYLMLWNHLGGEVDFLARTVTLSKEYYGDGKKRSRPLCDVAELQQALAALAKHGVDEGFVLKGTPRGFPARTVADAMQVPDPAREIMEGSGPLTLYHGTSLERWNRIQDEGLVPGRVKRAYNDLIPGYSNHNVYLATNPWTAEFYARRQASKDMDDGWTVLAVQVADRSHIRADDAFLMRFADAPDPAEQAVQRSRILSGIRTKGEVAHEGVIHAEMIRPLRFHPSDPAKRACLPPREPMVPCVYLVDTSKLEAASRAGLMRGGSFPMERSERLLDMMRRTAPPGTRSLRHMVAMSPLYDWDEAPSGMTAVIPPEDRVTRHDRSWLDEAETMLTIGNSAEAYAAASRYWSGSRLHGDWEFLAPWVSVPEKSFVPELPPTPTGQAGMP